jgi:hypothetical protein
LAYVRQKEEAGKGVLRDLIPYDNEEAMISHVRKSIESLGEGGVGNVKALVIGANGRCGSGAVDAFRKIGLKDENIVKWDMEETKKGGPFPELLDGKSRIHVSGKKVEADALASLAQSTSSSTASTSPNRSPSSSPTNSSPKPAPNEGSASSLTFRASTFLPLLFFPLLCN